MTRFNEKGERQRNTMKRRRVPVAVKGRVVALVDVVANGREGEVTRYEGDRGMMEQVRRAVARRFGLQRVKLAA